MYWESWVIILVVILQWGPFTILVTFRKGVKRLMTGIRIFPNITTYFLVIISEMAKVVTVLLYLLITTWNQMDTDGLSFDLNACSEK